VNGLETLVTRTLTTQIDVVTKESINMVGINYGPEIIAIDIPEGNLCFELSPQPISGVSDEVEEVRRAIREPIGCATLAGLTGCDPRVVIIVDDNTRPTPAGMILPILLEELVAVGVDEQQVEVIVASGTHRPMTQGEMEQKFGVEVLSRVPFHQHDCLQDLVDYGVTKRGTRIQINRWVSEADLKIEVGHIVPHHPTGWGGGAKMLLPGVAGQETTAQMHLLGSREPRLGEVDTSCRQEMEELAARIGPHFLINTVLNREGEIVKVVAGDIVKAHRVGVTEAKRVWGGEYDREADLTITSTYPVDFDLFQADKGIFSAELATRAGGEIVLVSPCYEGISPSHARLTVFGNLSDEKVWAMLERGEFDDPLIGAELLVFNHIERRNRVTVVSEGVDREMAASVGEKGLNHVDPRSLPSYIAARLRENPGLCIGVIHQSAELLPIKREALTQQS
jgi:nickel-dependent lactate racemase